MGIIRFMVMFHKLYGKARIKILTEIKSMILMVGETVSECTKFYQHGSIVYTRMYISLKIS